MSEMQASFRIEAADLTVRSLFRWVEMLSETFDSLDVPVEAKRRDTGEIYLQVKGEVT